MRGKEVRLFPEELEVFRDTFKSLPGYFDMLSSWPRHSWPRRYLSCSRSLFTSQSNSIVHVRNRLIERVNITSMTFQSLPILFTFLEITFRDDCRREQQDTLFYKADRINRGEWSVIDNSRFINSVADNGVHSFFANAHALQLPT